MTNDNPDETMTAVHLHSGLGALAHSFHRAGYRCLATHETTPQLLDVQIDNNICASPEGYFGADLSESAEAILARCPGEVTAVTASPDPLSDAARDMAPILDLIRAIDPMFFVVENTPDNISVFVEGDDGTPVSLGRDIRDRFRGRHNIDIVDVSAQTHFIGDLSWSKTLIVGVRADLTDVVPSSILPRSRPGGAQIVLAEDSPFITPAHAVEIGLLSPDFVIDDDGDEDRFDIVCQAICHAMPPAIANVIASPPPRARCHDPNTLRLGPAFALISDLPQSIFNAEPRVLALSESATMLRNVFARLEGEPAHVDVVTPRSIDMPTTPSAVDVLVHPLHDLDELISAHSYDLVIGHTDDLDPRTLRRVIESSATAAVTTTEKTVLRLAELLRDDRRTKTLHIFGPEATTSAMSVAGLVFSGAVRGDCDLSVVDHSLPPDTYVGKRHSVSQQGPDERTRA